MNRSREARRGGHGDGGSETSCGTGRGQMLEREIQQAVEIGHNKRLVEVVVVRERVDLVLEIVKLGLDAFVYVGRLP